MLLMIDSAQDIFNGICSMCLILISKAGSKDHDNEFNTSNNESKDDSHEPSDSNLPNPLYAPANDTSNPSEGPTPPSGSGDTGGSVAPSGDTGGSNSDPDKPGSGSNSGTSGTEQNQSTTNESEKKNHPNQMAII